MIAPFGRGAVTPRQMRKRPGACLGGAGGKSRRCGARKRHLSGSETKARIGASCEGVAVWSVGGLRTHVYGTEAHGA